MAAVEEHAHTIYDASLERSDKSEVEKCEGSTFGEGAPSPAAKGRYNSDTGKKDRAGVQQFAQNFDRSVTSLHLRLDLAIPPSVIKRHDQ